MSDIIETGNNQGPSNGWDATVRFSQPGDAYNNVDVLGDGAVLMHIEDGSMRQNNGNVLWKPYSDSDGRLVVLANGVSSISISGSGDDSGDSSGLQGLLGLSDDKKQESQDFLSKFIFSK